MRVVFLELAWGKGNFQTWGPPNRIYVETAQYERDTSLLSHLIFSRIILIGFKFLIFFVPCRWLSDADWGLGSGSLLLRMATLEVARFCLNGHYITVASRVSARILVFRWYWRKYSLKLYFLLSFISIRPIILIFSSDGSLKPIIMIYNAHLLIHLWSMSQTIMFSKISYFLYPRY